jgi:hypothetical protein
VRVSGDPIRINIETLIGAISAVDDQVQTLSRTLQESTALTDTVLDELSLQVAFLMKTIVIHETQHGGIAGPDGKVSTITKTAAQVYLERGRALMLKQKEEMSRAQGLSAEQNHAPDGDAAKAADAAGPATDAADAPAGTVTHAGTTLIH